MRNVRRCVLCPRLGVATVRGTVHPHARTYRARPEEIALCNDRLDSATPNVYPTRRPHSLLLPPASIARFAHASRLTSCRAHDGDGGDSNSGGDGGGDSDSGDGDYDSLVEKL